MYGMMMLVVGLLGAMIVRQTPLMSSDPTGLSAFGHPRTAEQSQAQAIADNLVLAHHEMQAECVEQTMQVVRDPRSNPGLNGGNAAIATFTTSVGKTSTTVATGTTTQTWPAMGPVNPTCGGSTAFSLTNTGLTGTLITDPSTTDTTDQRARIPMLATAGGPLGRIVMVRSGMYLITTWMPPTGATAAYVNQVCTLAGAYLRNRLGGADWVGSYDAAASAVRIWYGVGSIAASETSLRTSTGVSIPVTPQTGLTNGCPAYVEPIHN